MMVKTPIAIDVDIAVVIDCWKLNLIPDYDWI